MEVIKRIVSRHNFWIYNIPESFGEKAEVIIRPYQEEKNLTDLNESFNVMKAQEQNGSISMLYEPEEDAWNDL